MIQNLNYMQIRDIVVGNERRGEMFDNLMDRSTFLPKTLEYKDIDEAVKEFVEENIKLVTDEGVAFPTFTLYSNQRFNEYAQSWKYLDENKNLLLNFKTLTRESDSQYGKIHSGLFNIPGDRWYTIQQGIVMDDNGGQSFMRTSMKEPVSIDLVYDVGIFSTSLKNINDFNTKVNKLFASRQSYICPNGHYIALVLDDIDDTSEKNIDDRQYYAQKCTIKALAYVITEEDYRVEEFPLKKEMFMNNFSGRRFFKPDVEIEEIDELPDVIQCEEPYDPFYYQPVVLTITFDKCRNLVKFVIDTDMNVVSIEYENINENCVEMTVNDEETVLDNTTVFEKNDEIRIRIRRKRPEKIGKMTLYGYCKKVVYDEREDIKELPEDETNKVLEIDYH